MTDKPRAADPEPTGSAPGGSATADPASGTAGEGVVIRNNRKINMTGDQPGTGGAAPDGTTDGTRLAAKDPNPDPEPPGDAEPVVAAGEIDDTGSSGAAASVDDAKSAEDGPEVADDATTEAGEATTDDSGAPVTDPATPVVDEAELAEVLAEGRRPARTGRWSTPRPSRSPRPRPRPARSAPNWGRCGPSWTSGPGTSSG
ncbi:hypothetical protein GCM10027615_11960 [Plantactinospora veratri]